MVSINTQNRRKARARAQAGVTESSLWRYKREQQRAWLASGQNGGVVHGRHGTQDEAHWLTVLMTVFKRGMVGRTASVSASMAVVPTVATSPLRQAAASVNAATFVV